jgi:hypothetical protein
MEQSYLARAGQRLYKSREDWYKSLGRAPRTAVRRVGQAHSVPPLYFGYHCTVGSHFSEGFRGGSA